MEKLIKYFRSILVVLLCAMTAMDVIVIVAQVIFRFFLHVSLAWAMELAGVSLVWITFLGATLATMDESNINFNGFIDKLNGVPKLVLKTVCNLLVLAMCYIMVRYGYKSVLIGANSKMVALPTTMAVCCSVIPISGVFMAFAVVLNIVKDVKLCFGGFDADTVSPSVASIYDDVPEEVLAKATGALKEAENNDEDGTNSKGEPNDSYTVSWHAYIICCFRCAHCLLNSSRRCFRHTYRRGQQSRSNTNANVWRGQ